MPRFRLGGKVLVVVLFALIALGVMRFTGMERNSLSLPEVWIRDLLAPLQSGVTAVGDVVEGTVRRFTNYTELEQENKHLRNRIDQLQQMNNELLEAQLQNARLQRLLDFKLELQDIFSLVPARVISRGNSFWYQTLVIDRGMADGIRKGMGVVVPDGLVGRVIATSRNTAEVLTILDREGAAGAMLQLSRFSGVVEGTNGNIQRLQMIHLPYDTPVTPGEVVVTTGLDGIFPRGIRIGYVQRAETEPNGLMLRATVIPFVDFRRLEELFVITDVKRGGDNAGMDVDGNITDGIDSADDTVPPAASSN